MALRRRGIKETGKRQREEAHLNGYLVALIKLRYFFFALASSVCRRMKSLVVYANSLDTAAEVTLAMACSNFAAIGETLACCFRES